MDTILRTGYIFTPLVARDGWVFTPRRQDVATCNPGEGFSVRHAGMLYTVLTLEAGEQALFLGRN